MIRYAPDRISTVVPATIVSAAPRWSAASRERPRPTVADTLSCAARPAKPLDSPSAACPRFFSKPALPNPACASSRRQNALRLPIPGKETFIESRYVGMRSSPVVTPNNPEKIRTSSPSCNRAASYSTPVYTSRAGAHGAASISRCATTSGMIRLPTPRISPASSRFDTATSVSSTRRRATASSGYDSPSRSSTGPSTGAVLPSEGGSRIRTPSFYRHDALLVPTRKLPDSEGSFQTPAKPSIAQCKNG